MGIHESGQDDTIRTVDDLGLAQHMLIYRFQEMLVLGDVLDDAVLDEDGKRGCIVFRSDAIDFFDIF